MLIANFKEGDIAQIVYGLWQWDYGKILRIQGLDLPKAVEIHFALADTGGGESVTRIGTTRDGVMDVVIPDSMLGASQSQNYNIYVFVYLANVKTGETLRKITLPVTARPKPEAYDAPEDAGMFRETVAAVNEAADRADAAADRAEEITGEILAQVEGAKKEIDVHAEKAVSEAKAQIDQAGIQASKSAMETVKTQTAEYVETIQQAAETRVEAAGNTQISAVIQAGTGQLEAIDRAGKEQIAIVENAGTEVEQQGRDQLTDHATQMISEAQKAIFEAEAAAVQEVEETGESQIDAVKAAGTTQISEVQEAGIAQKDSIVATGTELLSEIRSEAVMGQLNDLQDHVGTLAPGIIERHFGEKILAEDGAYAPFYGLSLYGHSAQATTAGAQLFDLSKIEETWNGEHGIVKNSDGSITVTSTSGDSTIKTNKTLQDLCPNLNVGKTCVFNANSTGTDKRVWLDGINFVWTFGEPITITQEHLDSKLRFYASGTSTTAIISDIIVNKGTNPVPYEPYTGGQPSPSIDYPQEIVSAGSDGEIEVKVTGKNLFNKDLFVSEALKTGKFERVEKDGRDCLKITNSSWVKNDLNLLSISPLPEVAMSGEFFLEELAGTGSGQGFHLISASGSYAYCIPHFNDKGSWVTKKAVLRDVAIASPTYGTRSITYINLDSIQIETGLEHTSYEPPKKIQSLIIETPAGLPGIPVSSGGNYTDANGQQWIADEIDLAEGVRRSWVWSRTFDGSEVWSIYSFKSDYYYGFAISNILPIKMTRRAGYCDQFPAVSTVTKDHAECWIGAGNRTIYFVGMDIYDPNLSDYGLANWKAYLAEHPLTVMTYLDQPIETPLTAEEIAAYKALHTYAGTTVIGNDAECYMDVSYVADTETYINQHYVPRQVYTDLESRVAALERKTLEEVQNV